VEQRSAGAACLFLAAAFMGANGLFVKPLAQDMPVAEIVFIRFTLALAVVAVAARAMRRSTATYDLRTQVAMGCVGGATILMYFHSISAVGISVAALLLYTAPFFATVLSRLMVGERHTGRHAAALLVSFTGMVLILKPGVSMDPGLLVALGAGALFGLKMVLNRRLGLVDSAWAITFYYLLVPALLLTPYVLTAPSGFVSPQGRHIPPIAGLVLVSTVAGFLLQHQGFRYVGVADGAVVMEAEAVFAVLFGVLVFHESLDALAVLGGVLVLASGFYLNLDKYWV
jgi:drug/metabolite transporter (DMT)-like permease